MDRQTTDGRTDGQVGREEKNARAPPPPQPRRKGKGRRKSVAPEIDDLCLRLSLSPSPIGEGEKRRTRHEYYICKFAKVEGHHGHRGWRRRRRQRGTRGKRYPLSSSFFRRREGYSFTVLARLQSSPFIWSEGCKRGRKGSRRNERCILQRVKDRVTDGGVTGAFDYMPSSERRREDGRKEGKKEGEREGGRGRV